MTGRHWNEETQRWEEAGSGPATMSSPPPPRPDFAPPPTSWPEPELAGPAAPPPAGRNRRFALVMVGAAVLGAAVATTVVLVGRGDDAGPDPKRTRAAATTSAPASAGPTGTPSATSPTSTPSPTGELPADYREVTDAAGFTLAVPDGWERTESEQGVFYTSADETSLIQVFTIEEPDTTPLASLRTASETLSSTNPGYEEVSLEQTAAPEGASDAVTDDAAELVYAYDSKKLDARRKVVDFSFTARDGAQYAVLVAGPDDEWPAQRTRLTTALSRFSPAF
ncbi:hypothetical protein ABT127_22320 [Streptomyces sp. NPDC001904]|uniref:hypothetical protein n=1 Tax=Streptomyces sp. NPDC001904 TaxID=3154531 RepID=UPI003328B13D